MGDHFGNFVGFLEFPFLEDDRLEPEKMAGLPGKGPDLYKALEPKGRACQAEDKLSFNLIENFQDRMPAALGSGGL